MNALDNVDVVLTLQTILEGEERQLRNSGSYGTRKRLIRRITALKAAVDALAGTRDSGVAPSDHDADRDEARRQLAAEQAAHARFVQRISRALGDYTGSFEDACIARLEAYSAVVAERDQLKSHHKASAREHNLIALHDLFLARAIEAELERVIAYARCAHDSPEVERFCDALWQGEHRKEPEDG